MTTMTLNIVVTKRDGVKEVFNADKINRSIERACKGLTDPVSMVTQIATETQLTLYDGISSEDLDMATINAAVQNIQNDIEYDKVATRLLVKTVYKRVVGEYDNDDKELEKRHREVFIKYIKSAVADKHLDPRMAEKFDLQRLSQMLRIDRDDLFQYAGLSGLLDRYAIKGKNQKSLETPQFFFMRVAMGLSFNEDNPTEWAIKFYNKMSRHEYLAGGSTNMHAGTVKPSVSNCFLMQVEDTMVHIAKSVSDVLLLSQSSVPLDRSYHQQTRHHLAQHHLQKLWIPLSVQSSAAERKKEH